MGRGLAGSYIVPGTHRGMYVCTYKHAYVQRYVHTYVRVHTCKPNDIELLLLTDLTALQLHIVILIGYQRIVVSRF